MLHIDRQRIPHFQRGTVVTPGIIAENNDPSFGIVGRQRIQRLLRQIFDVQRRRNDRTAPARLAVERGCGQNK